MALSLKDMVRLLIADTGGEDSATFLFADDEIEAFLFLEQEDVYAAAAAALRSIAGNEVQALKVVTSLEMEVDSSKAGKVLIELAKAYDDKSDESYVFDIAAIGADLFSRRQLRADYLQQLEPGFGSGESE